MAGPMAPLIGGHRTVGSPGRHASAEADFDRNGSAAGPYSITSSAMDSRSGGTVRASARAVCRLMVLIVAFGAEVGWLMADSA